MSLRFSPSANGFVRSSILAVLLGVFTGNAVAQTASPKNTAAFKQRAESALAAQNFPDAWLAVHEWTDLAPADPAARLLEAQLYVRLGAPAAAIAPLRRGLAATAQPAATPAQRRALLALKGQAHSAVGEPEAAWVAYSELLKIPGGEKEPAYHLLRRARWDAFVQLSNARALEHSFNSITAAAAQPEASDAAQTTLARWLAAFDSPARAQAYLREALSARPESSELQQALANLILDRTDDKSLFVFTVTHQAELAMLKGRASRGFSGELLDGLDAYMKEVAADAAEPPVPPDLAGFVKNFLSNAKTRGAALANPLKSETETLSASVARHQTLLETKAGAPVSAAVWRDWETAVRPHYRAFNNAYLAFKRFADVARFLQIKLGERRETHPAEEAALKAVHDPLNALVEDLDVTVVLIEATNLLQSLPTVVADVRRQRGLAEARAGLEAARTPAEIFAASDQMILAGDNSAAMWRRRSKAADALHDDSEALASAARAFVAEWAAPDAALDRLLPAETEALLTELEQRVARADAEVANAAAFWQAGEPGRAVEQIEHALAVQPAHPAGWMMKWQWTSAAREDATAADALRRAWSLDSSEPVNLTAALATASRAGAWELLFSLADFRLAQDPTDMEAHLFRIFGAIACDRLAVAQSSLPLLEVSLDRHTGQLLASMLAEISGESAEKKAGLLAAVNALRNKPERPAGTELWAAYQNKLLGGAGEKSPATAISLDALKANPKAAHAELLAGLIGPVDYQSVTRGTTEEPSARWLTAMLARQVGASEKGGALLFEAAQDPALPLAFRALAHRQFALDRRLVAAGSLRRGDAYFLPAGRATKETFLGAAPGQEVVITERFDLADWPVDRPLRLRGLPGSQAAVEGRGPIDLFFTHEEREANRALDASAQPKLPPPRLWEFRDLRLTGKIQNKTYAGAAVGTMGAVIVEGNELELSVIELSLPGVFRLSNSSGEFSHIVQESGSTLVWNDVNGSVYQAEIAGTWRLDRGELRHGGAISVGSGGAIEARDLRLTGKLPWPVQPGGRASWENVIAINEAKWPATLPGGWSLQNVRVVGAVEGATKAVVPMSAPHRGEFWVIAAPEAPATQTFASLNELIAGLASAPPGAVLALAPGAYTLGQALQIPPGVTLFGRGVGFTVPQGLGTAFVFSGPGAFRLREVKALVDVMLTANGRSQFADVTPKTALDLRADAWVFVDQSDFYNWTQRTHTGISAVGGSQLEITNTSMAGLERIEAGSKVRRNKKEADAMTRRREAVAMRTREEAWSRARREFSQRFDSARDAGARVEATRDFVRESGEIAALTGATNAQKTRQILTAVVPGMQRHLGEVPHLNSAIFTGGEPDGPVVREMFTPAIVEALGKYTAAFNFAQNSGNVQRADAAYRFLLAYPPGSELYAQAMDAFKQGLTVAEFEAQRAAQKKREGELAVALAKQREKWAREAKEQARTASQYRPAQTSSSSSGYSGYSAPTYRAPALAPAWTPSESSRMQTYRQNLDRQISRVVGR